MLPKPAGGLKVSMKKKSSIPPDGEPGSGSKRTGMPGGRVWDVITMYTLFFAGSPATFINAKDPAGVMSSGVSMGPYIWVVWFVFVFTLNTLVGRWLIRNNSWLP